MSVKRIVITGAPGTGKTSIIKTLETSGFYCFHEFIRSMTLDAKNEMHPDNVGTNPIAFVSDSKKFNLQLLEGRQKQYEAAEDQNEALFFYDRGMPDVIAYMDYFDQTYGEDFFNVCKKHSYDAVFLLPPWKSIYVQDNERLETFAQATEIHEHLKHTYTALGYDVKEVPFGTVPQRIAFITNHVN
ncbi:AAA family ATPase [Maribacter chungangensis]|uniref:AAA family ATPase n=1 Tax=Maribacter chungangensis TaxID=1069117 RepID=A0ABW3B405_9FLAO